MSVDSPGRVGSLDEGVGVEVLRAAWRAVEAGQFNGATDTSATTPAMLATRLDAWTPAADESVVLVRGCLGSAGTTTVALAMASVWGEPSRLVERCPAWASGLGAAASAELGTQGAWRRGRRGSVLIERRVDSEVASPQPLEASTDATVLDGGVLDLSGPSGNVPAWASDVVLVTRATVPGLSRLERALEGNVAGNVVVGVVGHAQRRWPRPLRAALGARSRELLEAGRLVDVPLDPGLALLGITPDPLPKAVLAAGGRLLSALGKEPS